MAEEFRCRRDPARRQRRRHHHAEEQHLQLRGPRSCAAGDIYAGNAGAEFWGRGTGLGKLFNGSGGNVGRSPGSANFLAWWDVEPVRELLDGNHVDKYGTKSSPSLSGDLFGDWWTRSPHRRRTAITRRASARAGRPGLAAGR
jgi:hypothetical protein